MRGLGAVLASLLLGACPGDVGGVDPKLDAPPMIDGTPQPSNGVTIAFAAADLPLSLGNDVELESVKITTMVIRAHADSGISTLDSAELEWKMGAEPMAITFDQAPTGVYSMADIRITEFELKGEAEQDGQDHDFEIEGEATLLDVAINYPPTSLEPGGMVTLGIDVDLASIIAGINWELVEKDKNKLVIDDGSPEIGAVRLAIDAAFRPAI